MSEGKQALPGQHGVRSARSCRLRHHQSPVPSPSELVVRPHLWSRPTAIEFQRYPPGTGTRAGGHAVEKQVAGGLDVQVGAVKQAAGERRERGAGSVMFLGLPRRGCPAPQVPSSPTAGVGEHHAGLVDANGHRHHVSLDRQHWEGGDHRIQGGVGDYQSPPAVLGAGSLAQARLRPAGEPGLEISRQAAGSA